MSDVAALAGVSRSAVSVALSGHRRVRLSPETLARIQRAAETLGYRRNNQARNLRLQRSGQIALHITLAEANTFAISLLQPLLVAAEQSGYHVLVFTDSDDLAKFDELRHSGMVDAFLFTDSVVDDPRARTLADSGFPFACYGRLAPDLPQNWVDTDNVAASRLLVDHLVTNEPDVIAFYSPRQPAYWDDERLISYRQRLSELGDAAPDSRTAHLDPADIDAELRELVRDGNRWAVITSSRALAGPLVSAIRSQGLRVGTDVAVAGYDAPPMPWMGDPAISSAAVAPGEAARALLDRCLREIDHGPTGEDGRYLTPTLLPGLTILS